MSDVVRDLVVSLSLDAGEFTRNMRAMKVRDEMDMAGYIRLRAWNEVIE